MTILNDPLLAGPVPDMPDGPVELWFAVYSADGILMGAAPATAPLTWCWRDGRLCLAYGAVFVIMSRAGTYDYAMIGAVSLSPQGSPFAPLWRIGLGKPQELRAGDSMSILDGVVALIPDPP